MAVTYAKHACHCEERSDAAISKRRSIASRDCRATLAMTVVLISPGSSMRVDGFIRQ
jgi:hypothetical protein